jgi:hypothetical protein
MTGLLADAAARDNERKSSAAKELRKLPKPVIARIIPAIEAVGRIGARLRPAEELHLAVERAG